MDFKTNENKTITITNNGITITFKQLPKARLNEIVGKWNTCYDKTSIYSIYANPSSEKIRTFERLKEFYAFIDNRHNAVRIIGNNCFNYSVANVFEHDGKFYIGYHTKDNNYISEVSVW